MANEGLGQWSKVLDKNLTTAYTGSAAEINVKAGTAVVFYVDFTFSAQNGSVILESKVDGTYRTIREITAMNANRKLVLRTLELAEFEDSVRVSAKTVSGTAEKVVVYARVDTVKTPIK